MISRLFFRTRSTTFRHIPIMNRRMISNNHAYNGWIETMVSPFRSSFSPLQRVSQMTSNIHDRYRLIRDIEDDAFIQIRAIEIWREAAEFYMDHNVNMNGIENSSIVLKLQNSNSCFVLKRVSDGIQLSRIPLNDDGESISDCKLFPQQEMVKLKSYKNNLDPLSMTQLAEFMINEQSK